MLEFQKNLIFASLKAAEDGLREAKETDCHARAAGRAERALSIVKINLACLLSDIERYEHRPLEMACADIGEARHG